MVQPQDLNLGYFCLHSQLVLFGSLNVTSLNSTLLLQAFVMLA